ncbi:methyltransferase domain-containing protein [Aliiroseovarius sp. KMU-50]|uniref:Methyltransferase domain-containing protein n=1 Tax=Aliiroseovarius salicola TaxID=3009082 RepID=A0ABT4W308_9RHOB|nr:methyltransferase domain-containing protein [Aliiroseovarius sp. KMU-50]MDA5094904.1 methyltransferase domain-containing protein [Aliiroseovarius sp. KMU-50]
MNDFFNPKMAAQQERMARTEDMMRQRSKHMRVLSPKSGEKILELGSGNGIFARELAERVRPGGEVIGLDPSEAILEMARHIYPQGEFIQGDAQDLPFEDRSFDAVAAAQVFCFLKDVDQALAETYRVLKPQGRVVILDTDWDTLVWRTRQPELMARVMDAYKAVYANAYLPRTLPHRLSQAGFSNIKVKSFVVLNRGLGEETYARQSIGFATSIMEGSPEFSKEEQTCWLEDQEQLERNGDVFFSLNRYILSGRK